MIIGVDMLPLKTGSYTRGIGKYTYNLFNTLIDLDKDNTYYFYNVPHQLRDEFDRDNTKIFETSATREDLSQVEVFFITSLMELGIKDVLSPSEVNCKTALIFYDMIPAIFWDNYAKYLSEIDRIEYFKRLSIVEDFDIIFAISETTKKDLVDLLGIHEDKVKVIYSGLDNKFLNRIREDDAISILREKYGIQNRFVLSTIGLDFRKNIPGIFDAFCNLSDDISLVLVCKLQSEEKRHLRSMWGNKGLAQNRLILTNYVPTGDLALLYNIAEIFLFPSFYEGFGLPVLEAMSRGCPVITSNVSSLPEVCECAAIYIDPNRPDSIADAIQELLTNTDLKNKLVELGDHQYKKFNWSRVSLEVIESLDSLSDCKIKKKYSFTRYKVAYFTPLNPVKSGISDYSEDILPFLKEFVDIDIFIDANYHPINENLNDLFNIYPHIKFVEMNNKNEYDLCIYQVGNSIHHAYMLNYIFEYSGLVVLHDMTMSGLILPLCSKSGLFDKAQFLDFIFENHGYKKYLEIKTKFESDSLQDLHEFVYDYSLNFSKKILDASILTLVHNTFAKQFLERQSSFCRIWRINMGFDLDSYTADHRNKIKQNLGDLEWNIISTFGRITDTKRIDILLKAFSTLIKNKQIGPTHLYLVGELHDDVEQSLLHIIDEENLKDFVSITGYLDKGEFNDYYKITDVCVNLRYPSAGETSATLIKALRFGIPVITTNYAQYKEYPDNCCWKVDLGDYEVELLFEYLLELVTNENARKIMSKNAYEYAKESNSMERVVGQYLVAIDYAIKHKNVIEKSKSYILS